MSPPPNPRGAKRPKKTSRTDPEPGVKPVAQIPKRPKNRRKQPFVLLDWDEDGGDGADPSFDEPKKRGPKPLYRGDILRFRDQLVVVLEAHWPELQTGCLIPVDRATLLRILTAINRKSRSESSEHLVNYVDRLIELVKKNRVRNDPRQVANALAGLPSITIITSLKRCGRRENRCEIAIGQRARRAYLERKHPRLARLLSLVTRGELPEYAQALRDYDFRDPNVYLGKNRAEGLRGIWDSGIPDFEGLYMRRQKASQRKRRS
jgi:hypothetical protein